MDQKKSIKKLVMHGGILAFAGIIVRVIGLIYRIPMLNIIGDKAYGIYSTAFNVYNFMLVLSSYGLPMAISKLVSDRLAQKHYKDAKKIFVSSMIIATCSGGIAALFTYFGAEFIEKNFYAGYEGIAIPLKVLAPTIFIVSMLGVFRGFFQGQGTTIPTAISQVIEQIINALVSILAGYLLVAKYKESRRLAGYGAAGGTMGTAFGAFAALIVLVVIYMAVRPVFEKKIRRDRYSVNEPYGDIIKIIVATMIPIILGQTFYQISATLDDIMFGKLMLGAGISKATIQRAVGNYSSSYVILTGVVMGVASAMSASMLPSIVASKARREYEEINEKIKVTVQTNMFVAIPSFVGLVVLGEPIIKLLFPRLNSNQGGIMLKIGAIAVVFYTISTVTSSALQGIDKMNVPVKHSSISLVIHVFIVYVLLKFTDLGIYAIVIGSTTFPIVIMLLNLLSLNRYIGYTQEITKTFFIPLLSSLVMGIGCVITYDIIYAVIKINMISLMFAFIVAGVLYFGCMIMFKKKKFY